MSIQKAISSIRRCEEELQLILKDAATERDYESLIHVGELAKRIASILSQGTQEKPDVPEKSIAPSNPPTPRKKSRCKRTKRKSDYPKFAKRGDPLVKIGWSKKEKEEYLHKAPMHVAELLASALSKTPKSVKVITTDDIFPLAEDDGTKVPSYQSYLCLAWLRHEGMISQEGRQGYQVHEADRLISNVIEKWNELSSI